MSRCTLRAVIGEVASYAGTLLAGAVIGIAGDRLKSADSRRTAAWDLWVSLNEAVRTGDPVVVNPALSRWERSLRVAGAPKSLFRCAEITSEWYTAWYSVMPVGGEERAPLKVYDLHHRVVDRLRVYLDRPWWQPRNYLTTANRRLLTDVQAASADVTAFLSDLTDPDAVQSPP